MFAFRFFDPMSSFHSTRNMQSAFNFDSPFQQDPFFQHTRNNHTSADKGDSQNEEKYAEPAALATRPASSVAREPTIRPVDHQQNEPNRTHPFTSHGRNLYHNNRSPFEAGLHPEFDMIGGIFPLSHSVRHMERLMDQLVQDPFAVQPRLRQQHAWGQELLPHLHTAAAGDAPVSYSTTSSYSSHQSGSGSPMVYQSHSESRSIGGVSETKSRWADSLGNERCVELRRLGDQSQEVISEKNGQGEHRQHQNLNQIAPEQVDQFNQEWKQKFHWENNFEQPLALKDTTDTSQSALLHS